MVFAVARDGNKFPVGEIEASQAFIAGKFHVVTLIALGCDRHPFASLGVELMLGHPLHEHVADTGLSRGREVAQILSENFTPRIKHHAAIANQGLKGVHARKDA
jgi:hypothetical protein